MDLADNDHRIIGRRLGLFHMQEEAAGSVFWHDRGWTLFRTIETYLREKLRLNGYLEVRTPQIYDRSLWRESGHWEKFGDNMFSTGDFAIEELGDGGVSHKIESVNPTHVIKPMNCPGHVQIFNTDAVTYKQLPMRIGEFGCCHRNEPSGSLYGIMRVRQFTQDDAHIFCTEDQVVSETKRFCELLKLVYDDFGFKDVKIGLSTRPERRAGDDHVWDHAESSLSAAVRAAGLEFDLYPGEGAFYGPKLEFALRDNKGRDWQCGTLQLDFVLPQRLNARYMGEDGRTHTPVMLHRAILGSLERFIGILLEHHEGKLPLWLSPVQAVVMTIKPESIDYGTRLFYALQSRGLRVEFDGRDENVKQKVKEHSEMAVPYILAVGPRDDAALTVTVRRLGDTSPQTWNYTETLQKLSMLNSPRGSQQCQS